MYKRQLLALVQSLATPENSALGRKGFGLDYAATVGALYGICRNVDRGIPFRAQQDRMLATLARRFEVRPDQTRSIRQDFDEDITFAIEDSGEGRADFEPLPEELAPPLPPTAESNEISDLNPSAAPPEEPRRDFKPESPSTDRPDFDPPSP